MTEIAPIHPGQILETEFMKPYGLTADTLAKKLYTSHSTIVSVVRGTRPISPELALRLSALFGTSAKFWVNLQSSFALRVAKRAGPVDLNKIKRLEQI